MNVTQSREQDTAQAAAARAASDGVVASCTGAPRPGCVGAAAAQQESCCGAARELGDAAPGSTACAAWLHGRCSRRGLRMWQNRCKALGAVLRAVLPRPAWAPREQAPLGTSSAGDSRVGARQPARCDNAQQAAAARGRLCSGPPEPEGPEGCRLLGPLACQWLKRARRADPDSEGSSAGGWALPVGRSHASK